MEYGIYVYIFHSSHQLILEEMLLSFLPVFLKFMQAMLVAINFFILFPESPTLHLGLLFFLLPFH